MQFTPENKAHFDEILTRYPVKRSALLPALHLVQKQEGWISSEAIEYLASLMGLTPAQVHDTASYYVMFRLKPFGETHIEVCTNLSCALAGADALIESTCRKLGVEEGERTPDGKFTVTRVECLAACGGGPAVQVDGEWLENCTEQDIDRLLAGEARAPLLRLAEERRRDHPAAQRLQGELDRDRRLREGRRLREPEEVPVAVARRDHRAGEEVGPARPRRRRVSRPA